MDFSLKKYEKAFGLLSGEGQSFGGSYKGWADFFF